MTGKLGLSRLGGQFLTDVSSHPLIKPLALYWRMIPDPGMSPPRMATSFDVIEAFQLRFLYGLEAAMIQPLASRRREKNFAHRVIVAISDTPHCKRIAIPPPIALYRLRHSLCTGALEFGAEFKELQNLVVAVPLNRSLPMAVARRNLLSPA